MIKTDSEILFQDPSSRARRLCHSRVIEVDRETFTVAFGPDAISLCVDDELPIFLNAQGEFMQQVVRVLEVSLESSGLIVRVVPCGEATSAETRDSHRVSTISADVHITLGEEVDCSIQDLGSNSLAVVARGEHPIGSIQPVVLEHQGNFFSGEFTIQSRRVMRPGHFRYGLRLLAPGGEGDMLDGLQQIQLMVERAQLKRS